MASKCGKNKKVAHEAIAECVTDAVLYNKMMLFYIITKKKLFLVQNLSA